MHTCKAIHNPATTKTTLSLFDGELLADPTEYGSIIGVVQYLTMTRPDIAYAIHVVFLFMCAPCTNHRFAIKHVLRCLLGALNHGILLRAAAVSYLVVAYSDARLG